MFKILKIFQIQLFLNCSVNNFYYSLNGNFLWYKEDIYTKYSACQCLINRLHKYNKNEIYLPSGLDTQIQEDTRVHSVLQKYDFP